MKKNVFITLLLLSNFINAQENILTINITKVFIGKNVNNKFEFSDSYTNDDSYGQVINIEKKNGFLIYKNSMKATNSSSYGPISEIIYQNPSSNELSTQFLWDFSNSYDENKGLAYIDIRMIKNKISDKNKIFVAVIVLLLDNKVIQYEGYINSSDFIKIK
jgi:hypothetical protein